LNHGRSIRDVLGIAPISEHERHHCGPQRFPKSQDLEFRCTILVK
jgi:hypothetical protein